MRLLYRVSGPKVYLALKHRLDAAKRARDFIRSNPTRIGRDWDEHIARGNHIVIEELEFRIKHLADASEFELTLDECKELGLTEATPFVPADVENVRAA